jgi:hypothetical protein
MTFAELKAWWDSLPDQQIGTVGPVPQYGGRYTEFCVKMVASPDNVEEVEAKAVEEMIQQVNEHFMGHDGTIYWRVPLEWRVEPLLNNKKKIRISAYCRLARALKCETEAA